jgi:hypothetical protein
MTKLKTIATALLLLAAAVLVPAVAGAEAPTHEIQKVAPRATVGTPGKASVTVQGKNGWHVNAEAPITLSLKADPGLELPKAKLARADLSHSSLESARFDVPFSATAEGKKTITCEARFVMCQEQACKPVKETVALEVEVAAAAAPPPAAPSKTRRPAGKKASP